MVKYDCRLVQVWVPSSHSHSEVRPRWILTVYGMRFLTLVKPYTCSKYIPLPFQSSASLMLRASPRFWTI